MTPKLTLYTRKDCCLCDEMKAVVREVMTNIAVELNEIDIDESANLRDQFGSEAPVLFIDGRKAFKYKVTAKELTRRLNQNKRRRSWF